MDRRAAGYAGAAVCVFIWGITFIVSKELMLFLSPLQLMSMRFAIALVILWILCPKWSFDPKKEWAFILMALFGNLIYFYTENLALTKTYASNVSIIASTTSLMSLVLMHVFYKDPIHRKQVNGFLMAIVGVSLVSLNGAFILKLNPEGDMLVLISALSWAAYGLLLRGYGNGYSGLMITRKMMFYGLLMILPLALIEGHPFDADMLMQSDNTLRLLFLGVLGSCVCFVLWNFCSKEIGIVRSNIFLYAMPVVSMIAGHIVFDERIEPMAVIGMVLIIAGMFLANRYTERSLP